MRSADSHVRLRPAAFNVTTAGFDMKSQRRELRRCQWAKSPLMIEYHDHEWGVPLHDDRKLFELLILEGAQAGLSWETILNKRENYRRAFEAFDPTKIALYDRRKVRALLDDSGIVRNRLKIEATITNAQAFLAVKKEFGGFDRYIWQFVAGRPKVNRTHGLQDIPASTPESDATSKDLKKRGFRFVGTTICYAFMQAAGMVNEHAFDCFRRGELQANR
jgi:DNA-3-methyladenine glycosylase I